MKLLVDGDFSTWSRGFDYDDCLGLIMALNNADVKAVTCVGGNVPVKDAVRNALKVTSLTSFAPVYEGLEPPYDYYFKLLRKIKNYFDNRDFLMPALIHNGGAVKALNSTSVDKAVFTGPLTNLAASTASFNEAIIMAGAVRTRGNITPLAEFNSYLDPHALNKVLNPNVTIIPLDVTRKARIGKHYLNNFKGELAHLSKLDILTLHDPLAVAYALKPELFSNKIIKLRVHERGVFKGWTQQGRGVNIRLITNFDRDKFINFFLESINKFYRNA